MIEAFDLGSIGRSPARFDFAKLENLNGHYMRQADDEELVDALEAILPELGADARASAAPSRRSCARSSLAAMPGLKERAKTLVELLDSAYYLYAAAPAALDEKAGEPARATAARASPASCRSSAAVSDWTAAGVEAVVRAHAEAIGAKLGQVAQPLARRAHRPGDLARVCSTSWRCSGKDETLVAACAISSSDAPAA